MKATIQTKPALSRWGLVLSLDRDVPGAKYGAMNGRQKEEAGTQLILCRPRRVNRGQRAHGGEASQ